MKKLLPSFLLLLLSVSLHAQTWEKLKSDSTGFLNMNQYSYATYKSYNNGHYVSEFKNVYKFGAYGWKKIQSLTVSSSEYDFLVMPEDTVVYAYVNSSTSKVNVIKTKGAYQEIIGTADFSTASATQILITRSANNNFVISYRESPSSLVKVMTFINGSWQNLESTNPTPAVSRSAFCNQNNKPTIAYTSQSDFKLYVTQFNGTNWVQLGGSINPNWVQDQFDIYQDVDGTLYLIYVDKDEVTSLLKWTGTAWTTISTLPRAGSNSYRNLKLSVSNGIIYIAYNYGSLLGVKKYEGTTLSQLGPASLSTTSSITNFFLQSFNGTPSIFYPQDAWGGKMTLSTWDNTTTTWETVEAKSLKKGITGISTITSANNVMYTAFKDAEAGGKISVMKYVNGDWSYVGIPGFSATTGNNTTLVFDANNVLHVLFVAADKKLTAYKLTGNGWVEISQNWTGYGQYKEIYAKFNSSNTLYVACYVGTNNAVVDYGEAYMCTATNAFSMLPSFWSDNISSIQMTLDANGLPVVAFTDYESTYKIYVKKFNGSSWADASGSVINSDASGNASITTDKNGVLYVGYDSWNSAGYNIKRLQGGSWVSISAVTVTNNNVTFPQLRFNDNNELAVFYVENSQLRARKLIGTTWSDLGNTNFNDIVFNRLSVAINKNDYYVAHSFLGGFAYRLLEMPEVITPAAITVLNGTTTISTNNAAALDLGTATSGIAASPATTITIKNTGRTDLIISSITTSTGFALSQLYPAGPINADGYATFIITATPNSIGVHTGTITINSNDATTGVFKLNVSVTGITAPKPVMVITQGATTITTNNSPELDLGTAVINTAVSPATTITIQNTGNATLNISSITTSSGFVLSALAPANPVAAGATASFTITATPGSIGVHTGIITINSNDATPAFKLNVRVNGTATPKPVMIVSQGTTTITSDNNSWELDLGTSTINTEVSSPTTITIQNTGNAPLNISSIAKSNSDFLLSALTPASPVAVGSAASFIITAKPSVTGTIHGTIEIYSNDVTSTFIFNVRVTGTAAPKPVMVVSHGTTTITNNSFPEVGLGTATVNTTINAATTITIQNTGNASLDISSITRSNSDFTLSSLTPSSSIAPGATASFTITTTPSAVGVNFAQIVINSNDATPDFILNVIATGTEQPKPIMIVSEGTTTINTNSTLDLGTSTINTDVSPAKTITIQNTGNGPLNVYITTTTGFVISELTATGPIEADSSSTFTITATPSAIGINNGTITIYNNDPTIPIFLLNVTATGNEPFAAIHISQGATSFIDGLTGYTFAPTIIGTKSAAIEFTITNPSTAQLILETPQITGPFELIGPLALAVNPGETTTFTLAFNPTTEGESSGSVHFSSNEANSPFILILSGTGTLTTSTIGKLSSDAIAIHPNPSNGEVFIQMNGTFNNTYINVYNVLGEQVLTKDIGDMSNTSYTLLLGDRASGIYFIEIITEQGTSLKRLIKE